MSTPVPDASEMYSCASEEPAASRPRSPSPSTKSTPDEEVSDKEFNKRLLVSLGMLLPALAAIIGVVAWAISAEVVMGAKREAARRHSESSMRLSNNKFDYSKFHHVPVNSLPSKEMLIDPKSSEHNRAVENMDFFNQKMEEIGHDLMMRKMDEDTESTAKASKPKASGSAGALNDKIKDKLTQENIAQLIEKLLSSHKLGNSKTPQIVVVAPGASQTKNASSHRVETRVTTNKPKAFNLKMAPAKEERANSKSSSKSSSAQGKKKSSSTSSSQTKRRPATAKPSKISNQAETSTKSTTAKSGKNYKTKIYEKEIDLLLQKIEKLEKQQNIKGGNQKDVIPDKVANSDLFRGKPSDIVDKLKGFLGGHAAEESAPQGVAHAAQQSNDWQPTGAGLPPPPPMPPMPFLPFMPPPMPHGPYGGAPGGQEPPMPPGHHQNAPPPPPPYPAHGEQQMEPSYQEYQHSAVNGQPMQQQQQPLSYEHHQGHSLPQPHGPEAYQQQEMPSQDFRGPSGEVHPDLQPNHMGQQQIPHHQNQPYPVYDGPTGEESPAPAPSNKRKKGSLFGGKFKLSSIFNSVMPKSKRPKQQDQKKNLSDNRNIHVNNGPMESMMAQESHMYPNVDRGQYGEQPGFSVNFGAGPMGGGGQIKASPMGILKSLMLPLTGIPKWVNGKVVLGIVLENGIGKKPKTIFQHFSTGRIRR